MPPWHADPKIGDFLNDPRLTDAEIATIDAWSRTGAKEGDAKDLPPAPVFAEGWHIKPDLVLTIPKLGRAQRRRDDGFLVAVRRSETGRGESQFGAREISGGSQLLREQ